MPVFTDGATVGKAVAHHTVVDIREGGAIATEHEVSLAGGKSLGLQFLSEEAGLETPATLVGYLGKSLLYDAQDAARTAGTVVDVVSAVLQLVGHGQHGKVGEQCHIVARGVVLSSLGHAVVLVELAKQLLEQRSHGVVVERR